MLSPLRVLLLAAVSSLLVSSSVGQVCSFNSRCSLVELTTSTGVTLSLGFNYESNGDICGVRDTGSAAYGTQTDTVLTIAGKVTVDAAGDALSIDATFTTAVLTAGDTITGSGSITGPLDPPTSATTITYSQVTPMTQVVTSTQHNECSGGAAGDPHFSGFLGQQFNLEGESGLVYNVLSAANMQINTRLVQLSVGDALTRAEMRMARLKSLFVLPNTYWFDHSGPYMGELGLAMLNGHQLYAQAGQYVNGFASVQLDGVNMSVSSEAVVLGSGADAITISHPTAHTLTVSTASVELTFTNSDLFFNIENSHLKADFDFQATPFGGALGQTANAAWQAHNKDSKWRKQVEVDALVESNNLFELSAPAGTVAA